MLIDALKYHITFLTLLIAFIITGQSYAQGSTSSFKISHLKEQAQNDVNYIYKDRHGFMWIGTLDGLHRYDGYVYKTYRVQADGNSIQSNLIKSIDEDSFGNIWIGTYNKGISKLDPLTETFTNFYNTSDNKLFNSNDVTSLLVDENNVVWSGNWLGVNRIQLDSTMNKIIQVDVINSENIQLPEFVNEVKALHQDKNDNIWIGTNLSLYKIINPNASIAALKFKEYEINVESICNSDSGIFIGSYDNVSHLSNTDKNSTPEILHNTRGSAVIYQNNTLWIGNRTGLYTLEKNSRNTWNITNRFQEDFTSNSISCNLISHLSTDINQQIWIGTRGGGVNVAFEQIKKFQHYEHNITVGSLSNNLCRSIFEDHQQNLWIGTEEQGVNFLRKNNSYSNGFQKIDVNNAISTNRAYCIEETVLPHSKKHKSLIWIGTSWPNNLTIIDPETLQAKPTPASNFDIGFIFALKSTNDSTLWVGTYGDGLYRFTLDKDGEIISRINMLPDLKQEGAISSFIIRSIFQDSKGNLWVGTDKGLNKLPLDETNSDQPKFEVFTKGQETGSLPHEYILQVFESKDGTIWIGTMGGGLLKHTLPLSDEHISFTSYTTENGLPNNTIKSINEDKNGYLWLSSNKGLTRFNPKTEEVINYDIKDGLQDNEFAEICSATRANGQIVIGGIKGFNAFYPEEIKSDTEEPRLFLTEFYIKNQEITPSPNSVLKQSVQFTEEINLKYRDNSFSFGFVGLNYNAPQKNNYQYILQGFDEQWYKAHSDYRIAKYTNIPPGEYTFKVIASNSDNVWSDEPAQIKITIEPPLYRSNKAFALYFLIVIGFMLLQRYLSAQKNNRRNELVLANIEKNKVEEVSQMKLKFFTNISHEFRTPLTLISAPLDKLIKENDISRPKERMTYFKLMDQNIKIMKRLINQLMDFRKLEQDKLKLNVQEFNIGDFVKTIYFSFTELAKQNGIDYQIKTSNPELTIYADPEKLERVIYNIIANAFKYSPNNKSIEVGVIKDSTKVIIYVKDNGIGIKEEAKAHIFERYFRDRSQLQGNVGGTGIGLALSKSLVELHKGEISFESTENVGSEFKVCIPLGKDHYNSADFAELNTSYEFTSPSTGANAIDDSISEVIQSPEIKPRVLIAEDNHDLRIFIATSLKNDFDVIQAEDGKIALELIIEHMPDLIISDIMMPEIDGIELCKQVKTTEATSHIPVILLTAKNTVESQIEGYETGADSYLNKPFNMDVLQASIQSILKNREQLRKKFQKEIEISPDLVANNSTDSKFMDKILSIIQEHLSDSDFSVEMLAEKYGVSRIYLNRKIKALTGETSNQFIRNIRLKHAAELLKQGEMNVSEVTWMVGYNDLKTFRTRFKEKFGVSPSEFANSNT
ncbi:hybrid sensor histidine kinase/response regulator transcription factor [Labilibacter marinus]|uniref:hybrid sensor histidine kinase/response regulator transcription factor n=1 Tax=Labilibacter marinus TaxID=1477105 RepID=UPI00094F7676|nr:two-component regulator propeller domain-containing protein [Labilibacter marinus]